MTSIPKMRAELKMLHGQSPKSPGHWIRCTVRSNADREALEREGWTKAEFARGLRIVIRQEISPTADQRGRQP